MSTTGWSELVQICQIIFKLIQNTVLLSRIKLRETDQQHWQQLLSCHDKKRAATHVIFPALHTLSLTVHSSPVLRFCLCQIIQRSLWTCRDAVVCFSVGGCWPWCGPEILGDKQMFVTCRLTLLYLYFHKFKKCCARSVSNIPHRFKNGFLKSCVEVTVSWQH